jgi:hypothetical protein
MAGSRRLPLPRLSVGAQVVPELVFHPHKLATGLIRDLAVIGRA